MADLTSRRPRTTKPAEQVRADLLRAAAHLLADRPLSDVAIADIAGAAGVATGTFYRHFPTKDAVVTQLRRAVHDELLERVTTGLNPAGSPDWWDVATALIESTTRFWFEDVDRSRVVLRGGTTDEAVAAQENLAAGFAEGIALGQRSGAVRRDIDADLAATLLLHGTYALIYRAIVNGRPGDPAVLVAGIVTLARNMLAPPGQDGRPR